MLFTSYVSNIIFVKFVVIVSTGLTHWILQRNKWTTEINVFFPVERHALYASLGVALSSKLNLHQFCSNPLTEKDWNSINRFCTLIWHLYRLNIIFKFKCNCNSLCNQQKSSKPIHECRSKIYNIDTIKETQSNWEPPHFWYRLKIW